MFDKEHNIDIVFRNGLKDFEALPPSDVWGSIPPVRPLHTWKRNLYPAAAVVAILMTLGTVLNFIVRKPAVIDKQLSANNNPTEQELIPVKETVAESPARVITMKPVAAEKIMKSGSETTIAVAKDPTLPLVASEQQKTIENKTVARQSVLVKEKPLTASQLGNVISFNEKERMLAAVKEKKSDLRRLLIGGSLSPAYSVISSGGDAEIAGLMDNENSLPTYTGGISVAMNVSPRLTLQTGVSITTLGQSVSGISVFSGLSDYYNAKGSYTYMVETASGTIVAENGDIYLSDSNAERVGSFVPKSVLDPSKLKLDYLDSDIRQIFRYLELPVIARYKVIDRRVDLNLSGGLSYGFLIENAAYAVVDQKSVKIGHTEGINDNSLSSQVGFGMEYDISKTLTINFEPVFRYYLTPFSDISGAVSRPYSFGLFSGFFFRF